MNNKLIFTGITHPQRANIILPKLKCEFKEISQHLEGTVESSCINSLITVTVETNSEPSNILFLRNVIRDIVGLRVHFLGYVLGCGYNVEIERVIFPNGDVEVFGVNFPALEEHIKDSTLLGTLDFKNILSGTVTPYVSIILSDFNNALIDSKNLPFYCYRCIESIMKFFKPDTMDDTKGWESMRNSLGIERDYINYVRDHALPVRHGAPAVRTDQEGVETVKRTWNIILIFFDYLDKKTSLP